MAELKSGVLGSPVGKIGNLVFRQMNGKTFVSNRPEKYNKSNSEKAKASRNGFSAVVSLAKLICAYPELKSCWEKARVEGTSAYHRIIKFNLPLTGSGLLTTKNRITPKGVNLNVIGISKEARMLSFNLGINDLISEINNPHIHFYAFIFFNNSSENSLSTYELVALKKNINKVDQSGIVRFTIELNNKDFSLFGKYLKTIIFLASVAEDNGGILKWTSTVAKQL